MRSQNGAINFKLIEGKSETNDDDEEEKKRAALFVFGLDY